MSEPQKQLDDFRNLKPYYDLVFSIMEAISQHSFERDLIKMTRSLRELIINTAPYIKKSKQRLDEIEKRLSEVLSDDYWSNSLSRDQQQDLEILKDNYINFVQMMRINIIQELEQGGFMPKTQIKTERKVNKNLMQD